MIVMGKIESGCCRVGDRCVLMPNRTRVEVTNIYYEEIETDSCVCGENVRLKLKNVEEEVNEKLRSLRFTDRSFAFRKSLPVSFFAIVNKNLVPLEDCSTRKWRFSNTSRSFVPVIPLFFIFMPRRWKCN